MLLSIRPVLLPNRPIRQGIGGTTSRTACCCALPGAPKPRTWAVGAGCILLHVSNSFRCRAALGLSHFRVITHGGMEAQLHLLRSPCLPPLTGASFGDPRTAVHANTPTPSRPLPNSVLRRQVESLTLSGKEHATMQKSCAQHVSCTPIKYRFYMYRKCMVMTPLLTAQAAI